MKVFRAWLPVIVMLLSISASLTGCGGSGGSAVQTAPAAPTGVSAAAGNAQATITWAAVSGATSYNIYWSRTAGVTPSSGTKITGATPPYNEAGLTNGTTYYYVVTAVNSAGESAASPQVSCTLAPPAAPTGVTAIQGNDQATIAWTAVSGATSYNIYWSTTIGVTTANGTRITGAANPYNQTGLTNGTTYYYVVTAVNGNGESPASAQASATPVLPAPTGVSATPGNTTVTVTWAGVPNATSYNIYWSNTAGVTPANGTRITGAAPPYNQAGLSNGTTYYYVITAVNGGVESAASAQASATPALAPPPAAPTGLTATPGNNSITVAWTAVPGATSYNVYWSMTSGVTPGNGAKVSGATNPYNHTADLNKTYYFVVTAVNGNGESTASIQASATAVASPTGYTQADAAGTWNCVEFVTGPDVSSGNRFGWLRANATIDASGNITVNSITSSSGNLSAPPSGTFNVTINSSGVVTQTGASALDPGNHGFMAANKQLIVGTGSLGTSQALFIWVKQVPGITFSNADLSSKSFVFHELHSGSESIWAYGSGTVNSSQLSTLSTTTVPTGSVAPPAPATVAITSSGILTSSDDPSLQGVMTPDKTGIFVTTSASGVFKFRIIQITGQTFSTADLAGTWNSSGLQSSSSAPIWTYGSVSIDNTGVATTLTSMDSTGNKSINSPSTLSINSTGGITSSNGQSANGQLSYNKNMMIQTKTSNSGNFKLDVILK